jgi:hypothetical protein
VIRTPAEILEAPREGTCLDLATLFCGLCLSYEVLPLIVVIEGHALSALSLTHGVRDWNGYRPGRGLSTSGEGKPVRPVEPSESTRLASLLNRSGKTIEEACNSGRMPGSAARRIDTLVVRFFGGGAHARDARALR